VAQVCNGEAHIQLEERDKPGVQGSLLPLITMGKGHPNQGESLAFENQAEKASQPEKSETMIDMELKK